MIEIVKSVLPYSDNKRRKRNLEQKRKNDEEEFEEAVKGELRDILPSKKLPGKTEPDTPPSPNSQNKPSDSTDKSSHIIDIVI